MTLASKQKIWRGALGSGFVVLLISAAGTVSVLMLAAIAGRTRRLVLGSAVTVLSTDDPVRVFQRFSTLNAISNGFFRSPNGCDSGKISHFARDDKRHFLLSFREKRGIFLALKAHSALPSGLTGI